MMGDQTLVMRRMQRTRSPTLNSFFRQLRFTCSGSAPTTARFERKCKSSCIPERDAISPDFSRVLPALFSVKRSDHPCPTPYSILSCENTSYFAHPAVRWDLLLFRSSEQCGKHGKDINSRFCLSASMITHHHYRPFVRCEAFPHHCSESFLYA